MTAHTPRGWHVNGQFIISNGGRTIADLGPSTGRVSEMEPNARLIAASPDLLQALKAAQELVGKVVTEDFPDEGSKRAILASYQNEFETAIAKATTP